MIIAGLTGSIGMGKSTTANLFREEGIPVFDADAVVHELYSGKASPLVEREFPGVVVDGSVNRSKLSERVIGKPEAMKRLENIVHPLVRKAEESFIRTSQNNGERLVVLDHPLLFEMKRENTVDVIIVVSTTDEEQRRRVLSRTGMTKEKFTAILDQQVPDAEKRKRADFIVDSGNGIENARHQVRKIISAIEEQGNRL